MHSRRGFLSLFVGVLAVLGLSKSTEASKKNSMLPDSVLSPWPDGFDPSKEYGRGIEASSKKDSSFNIKNTIRICHGQATRALPKGTQYELCIASTDALNVKVVYWYYSPSLPSISSSRLATKRHHFLKEISGIETFGRFYA